jgi:hypothetical protein
MRDFLERERERTAQSQADEQKDTEALRKASEHAKDLEKRIIDYSRQKNLPAVLGRDGNGVVVQRGNQRIVIIVNQAEPNIWEYHLNSGDTSRGLDETQMIDAVCDFLKNAS